MPVRRYGEESPFRVPAALGRDTTLLDAVDVHDPARLYTDGWLALVVAEGDPQEVAGQAGVRARARGLVRGRLGGGFPVHLARRFHRQPPPAPSGDSRGVVQPGLTSEFVARRRRNRGELDRQQAYGEA
ncbi:hypothetical protein AB0K74_23415 [Streptomyces sp. NPDC056159]|uniref:hypothetical protein n=1 Tax=Streptomyces sp. NPDC056159 TaxID=3155537 RepID=UPI00341F1D1C